MFATAHDDGRGARLTADDRTGIDSLYPVAGGTKPPAAGLAAPTRLTVKALSTASAALSWRDNASGEKGYSVERKVAGGSFKEVLSLPANARTAVVTGQAGHHLRLPSARGRAERLLGLQQHGEAAKRKLTRPAFRPARQKAESRDRKDGRDIKDKKLFVPRMSLLSLLSLMSLL